MVNYSNLLILGFTKTGKIKERKKQDTGEKAHFMRTNPYSSCYIYKDFNNFQEKIKGLTILQR